MFGCKYQDQKEPSKPEARDTSYRVVERASSRYHDEFAVVRDELEWTVREYARSPDKERAEKIAALLNGQVR